MESPMLVERSYDAARIARGEDALGHVARDDAAGADDGARADADAGADDGAAADPDVVADGDRLAGLQRAALRVIEGMQRRVDLHRRADETEVADLHGADVEDHAVEVEVDATAERDVGTEIAEERRLDVDLVTAGGEELLQ